MVKTKDIKNASAKKAETIQAQKAVKDTVVTKKKTGSDWAYYVSAKPEPVKWDIQIAGELYAGLWNSDKTHVCFRIPTSLTGRFEVHHHFINGRLIKGTSE